MLYRLLHFRVPELLLALVLGGIIAGISASLRPHEMAIPLASNSSFSNVLYAYPLTLRDTSCYAEQLAACTQSSTSTCCRALYDEEEVPEEAVDDAEAVLVCVLVPLAVLLIRLGVFRYIYNSSTKKCPMVSMYFWCLLLWDGVAGCLLSVGSAAVLTYVIKRAVGMPRPIFFALDIFASVHTSKRQDLKGIT